MGKYENSLGIQPFDHKLCSEKISLATQFAGGAFNMGCGTNTDDPIHASELLLKREYNGTNIFDSKNTMPTFIPEVFISRAHFKEQPIISYDVIEIFHSIAGKIVKNEPNSWLSREFKALRDSTHDINESDISLWLLKMDFLNLVDKFSSVNNIFALNSLGSAAFVDIVWRINFFMQENRCDHWFSKSVSVLYEKISKSQNNEIFSILKDWCNEVKLYGIVSKHALNAFSMLEEHHENPLQLINDCIKALNTNTNLSKEMKKQAKKRKQNPSLFIRDFLKKSTVKEEEMMATHASLRELEILISHLGNISGDFTEHWLYDELKNHFNSNLADDVVILSSFDVQCTPGKPKPEAKRQEFDFIILCPRKKLIVLVEVKNRYTRTAFEQLRRCKLFLEKNFGDVFGDGWTLCLNACFYYVTESSLNDIPLDLREFVITKDTCLSNWWHGINRHSSDLREPDILIAKQQIRCLLQIFLFGLHASEVPSKAADMVSKTIIENISRPEHIIFFSISQLPLMKSGDRSFYHVMFTSGYGCGKTTLLTSKCEQIANESQGEKVLFLMWSSGFTSRKTLLMEKLSKKWQGNQNIILMTTGELKELVGGNGDYYFHSHHLLSFLQRNGQMHVFIDEWRWYHETENIAHLLQVVEVMENHHLWISWRRDTINKWQSASHDQLREVCNEYFEVPKLSYSMRNARNIVDAARTEAGKLADDVPLQPDNFPEGLNPRIVYVEDMKDNRFVEDAFRNAINAARRCTEEGILILINDDQRYCPGEFEVRLAISSIKKVCLDLDEPCCGYFLFSDYENDSFGDVDDFLVKMKGILITDQRAAEGFETKSVITYASNSDSTANHSSANFYMRSITNLVIIKETDEAKSKRLVKLEILQERRSRDNSKLETRLESFRDWPATNRTPKPEDLAAAGFFYVGDKCLVQCISCNFVLDFQNGGDPIELHKKLINCDFMKQFIV